MKAIASPRNSSSIQYKKPVGYVAKTDLEEEEKAVKSTQSVREASILTRFLALLIDSLLIDIITITFEYFVIGDLWALNPVLFMSLTSGLSFLFSFCYFWGFETIGEGQTLAKWLLKLRTVDEKTLEPTTSNNYAINSISKSYFILLLIDLLIGFFNKKSDPYKRLRYSHLISHTIVIKAKEII